MRGEKHLSLKERWLLVRYELKICVETAAPRWGRHYMLQGLVQEREISCDLLRVKT